MSTSHPMPQLQPAAGESSRPSVAIAGTNSASSTSTYGANGIGSQLLPGKLRQYSLEELLAPFNTPIPQVQRSGLFHASLAVVAMLMLAIPLTYVGIMLLCVLAVVALIVVLGMVGGTAIGFAVGMFALLLLLLAGLFFFKPLLAPRKKRPPSYSLDAANEPVLFAYVARLCNAVGAPIPSRIDIDVEPNASASFAHGLWSVFGGNELVLTIGLPLAAGLDLRQFTGVLAHEFGHFNQGSAMRMSFIINTMNMWFARLVFEEDAWDEALFTYARQETPLGALARLLARMLLLAKYVFWGQFKLGQASSCFLSRQMEFDADRYEARIAGSHVFPYTSMNLQALGFGWSLALDDLEDSWQENRLGDDLPALAMAKVEQVRKKPDVVAKIKRAVWEEETGWLDTHPATSERIASAQQENAPGIYNIDAPASVLFRDFSGLCRMATLGFYQTTLGSEVGPKNLVPTARLVTEQSENLAALKTLYRYFQGMVLGAYELFPPAQAQQPPADPPKWVQHLHESRQRMLSGLLEADQAVKRLDQAEERQRELAFAAMILDLGYSFDPASFFVPTASRPAVFYARQQADNERGAAWQQVAHTTREAQKRLVAALQLLHVEQVQQRAQIAADAYTRCRLVLAALSGLEGAWSAVTRLRESGRSLSILLAIREAFGLNEQIAFQMRKVAGEVVAARDYLRNELTRVRYPFEHGDGAVSLGDFSVKPLPATFDDEEVLLAAKGTLNRLSNFYYRSMAHLTATAERVETAFGYAPLPEPPVDLGVDEVGGPWSLAARA